MKNLLYKQLIRLGILVVFLGLIISLWHFLILPTQDKLLEIKNAAADINQKRSQLIDRRTTLTNLENQKAYLNDIESRAIAYLPQKAGVVDFVLQLEEMVKTLGLEPSTLNVAENKVTPDTQTSQVSDEVDSSKNSSTKNLAASADQQKSTNGTSTSTFVVSFTGGFAQVQQFLTLLKTVDRFDTVDTINLTYGADGLTAQFNGKIYHQAIPNFTANLNKPVAKIDKQADGLLNRRHFGDPVTIPTVSGPTDPFGKL